MDAPDYHACLPLAELEDGRARLAVVNGHELLVCLNEGQVHAIASRCSHADQPLECGRVKYGWITCPAHGARFDLDSGQPLNPPATQPIAVYACRVVDGMIEVAV